MGRIAPAAKLCLRTLTEQTLLQHLAPAGVLVNGQGDILYLHGRTGMFLEPTPGEAGINNILKMARDGLRRELTTQLDKVAVTKEPAQALNLRVKDGSLLTISLTTTELLAADGHIYALATTERTQQPNGTKEVRHG